MTDSCREKPSPWGVRASDGTLMIVCCAAAILVTVASRSIRNARRDARHASGARTVVTGIEAPADRDIGAARASSTDGESRSRIIIGGVVALCGGHL
jgi:hypothetical protein